MANGDEQEHKYTETDEFVLWDKYECVAMHFNELIIRLRTQALGGLAGIVAISGLALSLAQKPVTRVQWEILCGTIGFFALAWFALWVIDMFYYNKLLQGAVDAIVAHEGRTPELPDAGGVRRINLSTKIKNRVPCYKCVVNIFYILVFVGLLTGTGYTFYQAKNWQPQTEKATEYKIQLTSNPPGFKAIIGPAKQEDPSK